MLAIATVLTLVTVAPDQCDARTREEGHPAYPYRGGLSGPSTLPTYETRLHYAGQIWLAITNYGLIGTDNDLSLVQERDREALRINYSPSLEFPAGSRNEYLKAGGLWIGGIVGNDTLVSINLNGQSDLLFGEFTSFDSISESSNLPGSPFYDPGAHAEQQYHTRFTDTMIVGKIDEIEGRQHKPLYIEVSQTSYAWSSRIARQFVIVECWVRNIGDRPISGLAMGVFVDADVLNHVDGDLDIGPLDDITGFYEWTPSVTDPEVVKDRVNTAWLADNNGDPVGGVYPFYSPRGAMGVRILRAPPVERLSYNWWVGGSTRYDWGPVKMHARTPRIYGGLGSPQGDRNLYYVLTNGEIDYPQLLSNVDQTAQGWRPPYAGSACDIADGTDTRQLLSVGPACEPLMPGDSVPFVYAILAGENVHTDPDRSFNCQDPVPYLNALDLSDLGTSAVWASWLYDTPGIDTDGDGYSGEFRKLGKVPTYYTGDMGPTPNRDSQCRDYNGAPDFVGPIPPECPAPGTELFIETRPHEFYIRWSGRRSETVPDPMTGELDFEGYRLYASKINIPDNYSLIATWDKINYRRHWTRGTRFAPEDTLSTLEGLRELYGDDFDPNEYTIPDVQHALIDTIDYYGFRVQRRSYFEPIGENRGNTYTENDEEQVNIIQKIADSTVIENGDTLRFGIYEARLTELNPSNNLYISVTAFDRGNERFKLDPLESQPGSCAELAVPIFSADVVEEQGLGVSVYPNPYRISYTHADGRRTTYYEQGLEAPEKGGRPGELDEQDRRIWFINLPHEATIRIYTLDGDLVRTIEHVWPRPSGSRSFTDYSSRTAWDLVTRNTQAVVSGIYLYRIDSPIGTQTGKIVIIK
ncbi:MAG: hypothetical protein Kow0074_06830 [Candidatus Zixiibacteriota bacterium]